jgi:Kef-type K+ transport system membrane component KefB
MTRDRIKKVGYGVMVFAVCFVVSYGMAAFANWEIDVREWSMLARHGVILSSVGITFIVVGMDIMSDRFGR